MNESEKIDPRELSPLALAFVGDSVLELLVRQRGRNASKASVAKHASPEEYRASTGFECLLGWLYLNGQLGRVHQLFEVLWQQFDPDQK